MVLIGKTSVEIVRQVLKGKHDLVLSIAKGKDSRRDGFFGTTSMRLLRDCPLLDNFMKSHGSSVRANNVKLIKGDASLVIPDFATRNDVDLVVMGTVARSGAAGLFIGNTAARILNRLGCSVLALKPDSFVGPITKAQATNGVGVAGR